MTPEICIHWIEIRYAKWPGVHLELNIMFLKPPQFDLSALTWSTVLFENYIFFWEDYYNVCKQLIRSDTTFSQCAAFVIRSNINTRYRNSQEKVSQSMILPPQACELPAV